MFKYKGYVGKYDFDLDFNIYHGDVINCNDTITFQGNNIEELNKAFIDSVEDYIEFKNIVRRSNNA